jgi:hypothetical protein
MISLFSLKSLIQIEFDIVKLRYLTQLSLLRNAVFDDGNAFSA